MTCLALSSLSTSAFKNSVDESNNHSCIKQAHFQKPLKETIHQFTLSWKLISCLAALRTFSHSILTITLRAG